MAVLLVVALVLGAVPWLGAEATTIAATGLVVLTTGFESDVLLISRLLDTAIGVAVGLLVNVIVWPPLRRRTAAEAMDRIDDNIGVLLVDMAGGLGDGCQDEDVDGWIDRSRDLDGDVDQAWSLVRQAQESARMNPRRSARPMKDPQQWHGLLRRMEQSVAETRSLARTLGSQSAHKETWGDDFALPWIDMLGDTGTGRECCRPGRDARGARAARGVHREHADDGALGRVAGLRRPDHQPAQHHRRDGRGRRGQPDRRPAGCRCASRGGPPRGRRTEP